MATFVALTEEDPAYELADVLAKISSSAEQKESRATFRKLVSSHKYWELVHAFFESMDKILATNEKEINATFNLCYSLLPNIDAGRAAMFCPRFVAALTQDQNFALLKLKLLSTLFNLWTPRGRSPIYFAILRFALASNNAAVLAGQLEPLKYWISEWKLSEAEEMELNLLAARVSQANNQLSDYRQFLSRYLELLQSHKPAARLFAKEHAVTAVVEAIKSMSVTQCARLLDLEVVTDLEKDPNHSKSVKLLRIMTHGTVDTYLQYTKEHQDHMEQLGLDQAKLLQQMRMLTLCTLGDAQPELSYATVQEKLQLKDLSEVESQVIETVASGLVDAKLDQEQQLVIIQRATVRSFDAARWKKLANKLAGYRAAMQRMLETFDRSPPVDEEALLDL